ncbi:ATP-binding cassette domain-containing protein [Luteococcus sp. OSA5]|uniref:ATP-binding cassette domain-containing protein n=1 Tax=Luteococcus sp. OSA5 TaxID=3401630 RepID=UPI003B43A0A5
MTLARLENLTLRIPTRRGGRAAWVHAATDVGLELRAGRVHALVGESGCGKSVIASVLQGLLPSGTRVHGRVEVDDTNLTGALGHPRHRLWRSVRGRVVSLVPQSPATSFTPTRTIGSQLAEVLRALDDPRRPDELAALAELPRWALAAHPHELSGGLVGRAALAAALAGTPRILVADEPTSALEPALADAVLARLRAQADQGMAVLLISHDLSRLVDGDWADDVSVMYAGRVVEQGAAHQVWHEPEHDYTRALLAALPRNGLHPVAGDPPELTDLDPSVSFRDRLQAESNKTAGGLP